jgi:hypothetical protein
LVLWLVGLVSSYTMVVLSTCCWYLRSWCCD